MEMIGHQWPSPEKVVEILDCARKYGYADHIRGRIDGDDNPVLLLSQDLETWMYLMGISLT